MRKAAFWSIVKRAYKETRKKSHGPKDHLGEARSHGGSGSVGDIEGEPELQKAYELGRSV